MDALTHAIESYVSNQANPISQALALHAIKMIKASLQKAYFIGTDIESRSIMLEASMIAGFAFSQSRLGMFMQSLTLSVVSLTFHMVLQTLHCYLSF